MSNTDDMSRHAIAGYLRDAYDPDLDYAYETIWTCARELSQLGFARGSLTEPTREQARCMNRHLGGDGWVPFDEDSLAELEEAS